MEKDIDMLYTLLEKHKDKYGRDDVIKAIIDEGYSKEIAQDVANKLYGSQKTQNNEDKVATMLQKEVAKTKPVENPKDQKITDKKELVKVQNYFEDVDKLLIELRELIPKQDIKIESEHKSSELNNAEQKTISNSVDPRIAKLTEEISSLEKEISTINSDMILTNDGKIIDLNNYPRREWRIYRENGKSLYDVKYTVLREKKRELKELQRNIEQGTEQNEVRRHRDEKKEEVIDTPKRNRNGQNKENDDVVDIIYEQVKNNPDAQSKSFGEIKEQKKEDVRKALEEAKEDTKKKLEDDDEQTDIGFEDLNLDLDKNIDTDLSLEGIDDLNLNLDLEDDGSKKKTKKSK